MGKYRPERGWSHFVPANKIVVSVFDPKRGQIYGELVSVTETGGMVQAKSRFESGGRLLLRIRFPTEAETFVTEAEVLWSREETGSTRGFTSGVRFLLSHEDQRSRLSGILSRSNAAPSLGPSPGSGEAPALDQLVGDLGDALERLGTRLEKETGGVDKDT